MGVFENVRNAVEGGNGRRRFLRYHKRRAEITSTRIDKHPRTIPAIAGPDKLDALDETPVLARLTAETLATSVDLGNISNLAIIPEGRLYLELSRYFTTRT